MPAQEINFDDASKCLQPPQMLDFGKCTVRAFYPNFTRSHWIAELLGEVLRSPTPLEHLGALAQLRAAETSWQHPLLINARMLQGLGVSFKATQVETGSGLNISDPKTPRIERVCY